MFNRMGFAQVLGYVDNAGLGRLSANFTLDIVIFHQEAVRCIKTVT